MFYVQRSLNPSYFRNLLQNAYGHRDREVAAPWRTPTNIQAEIATGVLAACAIVVRSAAGDSR